MKKMNKNIVRLFALLISVSFLLCGCKSESEKRIENLKKVHEQLAKEAEESNRRYQQTKQAYEDYKKAVERFEALGGWNGPK